MHTPYRALKGLLSVALSSVLLFSVASNTAKASVVDVVSFASTFLQDEVLGWSFVANQDLTVSALGNFDNTQQGLAQDMRVGLWASDGTLLADVVIAANGGTLDGFFWYETISPVSLLSGNTYVIGSLGVEQAINVEFQTAVIDVDPAITIIEGRFSRSTTSLVMPTQTVNQPYFGPNFRIAAVPGPATLALLSLGLIGLGFKRKVA